MLHVTLFRNLPRGSRSALSLSLSHTHTHTHAHTEAGFYICDKMWKYIQVLLNDVLRPFVRALCENKQANKHGKPRPDVTGNESAPGPPQNRSRVHRFYSDICFSKITEIKLRRVLSSGIITPYEVNRRFGGTYRLHLQGSKNKPSKKRA
jgi:hypothetical protein